MGVCDKMMQRFRDMQVPTRGDKGVLVICGILNCFLFGVGMIILGLINNDMPDVLTGIVQLILPFVGWLWAIVWGILIVSRNL